MVREVERVAAALAVREHFADAMVHGPYVEVDEQSVSLLLQERNGTWNRLSVRGVRSFHCRKIVHDSQRADPTYVQWANNSVESVSIDDTAAGVQVTLPDWSGGQVVILGLDIALEIAVDPMGRLWPAWARVERRDEGDR